MYASICARVVSKSSRRSVSSFPKCPANCSLAAEAGVQPGLKVELLTYNSPRGYNSAGADLAVAIQGYLKRVGIEADVRRMDMGAFLATVRSGKHEGLKMEGWTGDNGDPDNFAGALFASKEIPIGNWAHYRSADVDRLLAEAARTVDHDKRVSLYSRHPEADRGRRALGVHQLGAAGAGGAERGAGVSA